MFNKLFDNKFWYVGFTHAEFDGSDYENNPCLILRNPFGKWSNKTNCYCEAYKQAYQELQQALPNLYSRK